AGLRAGAVAADVDTRHLNGWRHGEERPHVAGVRQALQLFELEVLLNTSGGRIDDGRLAGDGDRLLQCGELEFDVHIGGEAQRDLNAFTLHRVETGELVAEGIHSGRHCREPVVAGLRGDCRLLTEERGAGRDDGDAWEYRALRVRHTALNRTRAACATTLC